jgi:hypothetical protein
MGDWDMEMEEQRRGNRRRNPILMQDSSYDYHAQVRM